MKFTNLNIHYFLLFFLVAFVGCTKKSEEVYVNGEPTLVFNVSLFEQTEQVVTKASISSTNPNNQGAKAILEGDFKSIDGFSFAVDAEQTSINSTYGQNQSVSLLKRGDSKNIAATSPMTAGYTYRVLLYRSDNNTLFKSFLAKSGEAFAIEVPKGVNFTWYAYSYNDDLDIPEPASLTNPMVETSVNRDFMYASGNVSVLSTPVGQYNNYPINIVFKHKVTQVKLKLDATDLTIVSNIQRFKLDFAQDDYFKKGVFSIKENTMSNSTVVPTAVAIDTGAVQGDIYEKSFYTVDASNLTQYVVNVKNLQVNFFLANNGAGKVLDLATYDPVNPPKFTFKYQSPQVGQSLVGKFSFVYTLQSRKIYHVSNSTDYAYSLQRGPGWQMLRNLKNFGNLPESIVKMMPYNSQNPQLGVWQGGGLNNSADAYWFNANTTARLNVLKNDLLDVNARPDILIIGFNQSSFPAGLPEAIISYVNAGGVLIWFNEFNTAGVNTVLNGIFDYPAVPMEAIAGTNAGSMYPLLVTPDNDRVLNGPFGDARGKLWGEDASTTYGVRNLPLDKAIVYSYAQAINRPINSQYATMPTMFKHKGKNFFYLGDGGLVSYNGGTSATICPFDYDPVSGKPLPKLYGNAYASRGYAARSQYAYNGVIAGNVVLWAAAIAEFSGVRPWKYD